MFKVIKSIVSTHNMYKRFKEQGSIYFYNTRTHDTREITDIKEVKRIIRMVIIRSIKMNLLKMKLKEIE